MAAPAARTEVVRDTYFGVTVEDPYRWLEDVASDEVRSGEVPELVVRDPADAPERVLLDPGVMAGAAHRAVDWYVPSPDGRHVACGVSQGGSERSTLHVVEVGTGRLLDDAVTEADVVVLARGLNPRVPMTRRDRPFLAVSPNEGWLLAIVSHGALGGRTTDEELTDCTLYVAPRGGLADPASCPWRRVAGVEDAVAAYALTEETLYLVSGRDAPRYQVLAVPLTGPGCGGSPWTAASRRSSPCRSRAPSWRGAAGGGDGQGRHPHPPVDHPRQGCAATAATRRCWRPTAPTGSRCVPSSHRRCWPGTSRAACTPSPTSGAGASMAGSGTRPGADRARRPPSAT